MNYEHIKIEHVANLQLQAGETLVGVVHTYGNPVVLAFTNTGRVIYFQYDRY